MCRSSWIWAFAAVMMVAPSCAWAGEPADRERAIVERMEAMQREAKQLREQGKVEQAEQVQRELERMVARREHQEVRGRAPERREPRPEDRERAELERRLHHIHAAIENLEAIGMRDVVERLVDEANEIERALRGPRPEPRPEDREREELEQRLQHIRVAAENLNAIGMHDVVERLEAEGREIEQALHGREHGPGEVPPEVLEHIHHNFAELTERVEQLTRHLEEVTEAVERLQRKR